MIILNFLQTLVLIAFVVSSVMIMYNDRHTKLGVVVKENDFIYANGKQGLHTTIGRSPNLDVVLKERTVSRLQAIVSFNPLSKTFDLTEYGRTGSCKSGYSIANHDLKFSLTAQERCYEFGFVPLILTLLFIFLQGISMYIQVKHLLVLTPYILLIGYMLCCWLIRADRTPITEAVMSILLTYYVECSLHLYEQDEILAEISNALLGVTVYVICSFVARGILKFNSANAHQHSNLRILAMVGIAFFIILNLALANEIGGAYNWISIAGISFQPSEIVKILYAFVLIAPVNKHFYSTSNIAITLGTSVVCFLYALLIRDVGALLLYAGLFGISMLLQNRRLVYSIILFLSAFVGCKIVTMISATAASRLDGWFGESDTWFEALTAAGAFDNPFDYGYQPIHALVASFKNGGLFGNTSFDVLENIEAANSDLATALIAQRHGFITLFLILGVYLVLLLNTYFTLQQKDKVQQIFSVTGMSLAVLAMTLNLCGSHGLIPLTGIVTPFVSNGISAAIPYGMLGGILSSTILTKPYLEQIRKGV